MLSLHNWIQNEKDRIINDLSALVAIPSIYADDESGLPFGQNIDAALEKTATLFCESGMPMSVKTDKGYALYQSVGTGNGIGIFAHTDVVPVSDDWLLTNPFSPIIKDGFLIGRGVNDNKAGVIGALYALKALKAIGVKPKRMITVFIGGNEEESMQDIDAFLQNEAMPDISLIPDSDFPVSIGEKGILHFECLSDMPFKNIRQFDGGNAYNVVLDNVTVKIADCIDCPDGFTKAKDGFLSRRYKGISSHAAYPEHGKNAAILAAKDLCRLPIDENDKAVLQRFVALTEDCHGNGLGIAHNDVFGPLTAANGIVRLKDEKLFFTLDIRYGTSITAKECVMKATDATNNAGFSLTVSKNDDGFLLNESGEGVKAVLDAYKKVTGKTKAAPYLTYGGTYARHLKNGYAFGHSIDFDRSPLHLPTGHGEEHQSDECLNIDAFLSGIEILAEIIIRLDRQ